MTEPEPTRDDIRRAITVVDTCGYCTLHTFAGITVRSIQSGCPVHSGRDSTAPRRVPTEVERAAAAVEAGHAWRHTANSRPGYATWPNTAPGSPSWWGRDVVGVDHLFADEFAPYLAEHLRDPEVKAAYEMELRKETAAPRRRWWHRLTQRAL